MEAAIGALLDGGVVVAPTDTVYGLLARATDAEAVASVFAWKRRPPDVPPPVIVAEPGDLGRWGDPGPVARRLADRHWPGPVTLVVRRRPGDGLHLGAPSPTVGLRCPADTLLVTLARAVEPLVATSANLHGEPTPATAAAVVGQLGFRGVVLRRDPCGGVASTVVDCTTQPARVLRRGPVEVRLG